MLHIVAFNVALAGCLVLSIKAGGGPEKLAMLSQVFAGILTAISAHFLPHVVGFATLAGAVAAIDATLLVVLTSIALKANRLWTIVLAGLQFSTVLVHLSKAAYPALPAASYGIFAQFWAWPMLLATALGTWRHRTRVRKEGDERDWKPLWPHSYQKNLPN